MDELLSGTLLDVALGAVAIEVVLLVALRRRLGLALGDVAGQILAGALLLLALRCAVTGADARWTLGLLAASFPAHLVDLARRSKRARAS